MTTEQLPQVLVETADQAVASLSPVLDQWPEDRRHQARRVLAASRFVREWCLFQPDRIEAMLDGDLPPVPTAGEQQDFDAALRRFRNQAMVRIAWHEISQQASAEETVAALSDLADECLARVLAWHLAALRARHGVARLADGGEAGFAILGLGKLGGRELNFSSDVDLIFAYAGDGESDGEKPLSNAQYFARLGQRIVASMQDISEHGFVFRVDLRLRPFGEKSPIAHSLASLEEYYEGHGREWERYAWIKARQVAGDVALGRRLIADLQPFVYRRYLDYGAIAALRDMKQQIDDQVRKRGHEQDIKLGWGGIREVEFIVQVFQLVRGGAEPALRSHSIMQAMAEIEELGLHPADRIDELRRAYWFLRRVENCWQAQQDRQSHVLPDDEEPRQALAVATGFDDWSELDAAVQQQRAAVHAQFAELFAQEDAAEPDAAWLQWWSGAQDSPTEGLASEQLQQLRDKAQRRLSREEDRDSLGQLLFLLRERCEDEPAAERVLGVVEALIGRSNYINLLLDNAVARRELSQLCARSPWLAAEIRQYPMVLAELLDPVRLYAPDLRAVLRRHLRSHLEGLPQDDVEARMDVLRRVRHGAMLRIAAADVAAALPIMRVSDRLTELAEEIVAAALDEAVLQMRQRYPDLGEPEFAVIAYGKLGGLELGYSSDLDLVFVYDAERKNLPLDPAVFYTRLAQKLIHCLATPTGAGTAYEIDTRLRPSGNSGLLVTSIQGLARYQREQAWTWEHQALIRARPVAGSAALGQAFRELRRDILAQPRDRQALLAEVQDMRAKMRGELAPGDGSFDPKQSPGGMVDIEFFVQFAVLALASECPSVCRFTDVIRNLEVLRIQGYISAEDAETLSSAYRKVRSFVHVRFLTGVTTADDEIQQLAVKTDQLIRRLQEQLLDAGD